MKPVKLEIEGINSFTDRQVLDFTAVGRNNLFCICGKTGAGKSTIFDCILFALYGRSSRGDLADMVNVSRMRAFVALEFEERGETYRVERTIKCRIADPSAVGEETKKRSRKKNAEAPENAIYRAASAECVLYRNGEPVSNQRGSTDELIKSIIGLESGEFKNVYLLEQGAYAEFLKRSPTSQLEAVGKIFSLQRFGAVTKLAREKEKEVNGLVDGTLMRIDDQGDVTPELIRTLKTELASRKAKNTALAREIEKTGRQVEELTKQRDTFIKAVEKFNAVKKQEAALSELKEKSAAADAELEAFRAADTGEEAAMLAAATARCDRLAELNVLDHEHAASLADERKKREIKTRCEAESAKASSYTDGLKQKAEQKYTCFNEMINAFFAAANELPVKSAGLIKAIEELAGGERAKRIASVSEHGHALRAELTAYNTLADTEKDRENRLARQNEIKTAALKKTQLYSQTLSELEETKAKLSQALSSAEQALASATLRSHAAAVRSELKPGDVCPVCGGEYKGHGDIDDVDVAACKRDVEKAARDVENMTSRINGTVKLLDAAKTDYDRADAESKPLVEELEKLSERMKVSGVDPAAYMTLLRMLAGAKTPGDEYLAIADELVRREPVIAKLTAELNAAEAAVRECEAKTCELAARLGEYLGKTDGMLRESRAEIAELKTKAESIEKRRNELTAASEAAHSAVNALSATLDVLKTECPAELPVFDDEKYDECRMRLDRLKEEYNNAERDIVLAERDIKQKTESYEKIKQLEAERRTLAERAKNYAAIAELTKSRAMLNYVAEEYINEFTAIAAEILGSLSGGKYSISYSGTNGFVISDYLNGGRSRRSGTLSGGEMFLASLSVAIAIARAQSKGNNAFFFLDEGFGTLDEELIDTVYGALESLSRDCLVGVISHAGALIERMPATVEIVEATDTVGSLIKY